MAHAQFVIVLVVLVLSIGADGFGKELTFRHPRDLLVVEPQRFIELLDGTRPTRLSPDDMATILSSLPPEGEVTPLDPAAQRKVDAVRRLLNDTGRGWYEIKVIDLPQAAVVLYARAVILISATAIAELDASELQALAAHEIGHEYVWIEWHRAHERVDRERLKELELVCDAIAAVTLRQLGMDSSRLIDGVEKVTRFNRERFGSANSEKSYPTLEERRAFAREINRWLLLLRRH